MGQLGAAFSNPNTFAPDPKGFNGSEVAARLMGGAGKGALQGFSDQQNSNRSMPGGGGFSVPMPQQPQVNLPGMDGSQWRPRLNNQGGGPNPFFGG